MPDLPVRIQPLGPEAFGDVASWAEEVARVTREGFALPGRRAGELPPPDGASESARNVLDDLERGVRVWVARVASGKPAGIVRAVPAGDGVWELKRLSVSPAFRGLGLGRRLVRHVEQEAARHGADWVTLHCVVERLLPPFYGALGYAIVARGAHPTKPLTEVRMERHVGAAGQSSPTTCLTPWGADAALPTSGAYVVWLWLGQETRLPVPAPGAVLAPGLYAYVGSARRGLRARLVRHAKGSRLVRWHVDHLRRQAQVVGADVQPDPSGPGECRLAEILMRVAPGGPERSNRLGHAPRGALGAVPGFGSSDCRCPSHLVYLGPDAAQAAAFVTPRVVEPRLLAVFRLPVAP